MALVSTNLIENDTTLYSGVKKLTIADDLFETTDLLLEASFHSMHISRDIPGGIIE